jgi:polyhydroxyalkanoate synthesis regulator phasin
VAQPGKDPQRLSEALRAAIERTFAASADSASQTRGRAQELLDEVSRRGQEAGQAVARRGQEAGAASATAASRVIEAIEGMRLASREDLRAIEAQVDALAERIAQLEALANRVAQLESKAKVEG